MDSIVSAARQSTNVHLGSLWCAFLCCTHSRARLPCGFYDVDGKDPCSSLPGGASKDLFRQRHRIRKVNEHASGCNRGKRTTSYQDVHLCSDGPRLQSNPCAFSSLAAVT